MEKRTIMYVTGVSTKNQLVYSQKVRTENLSPVIKGLKGIVETGFDTKTTSPKPSILLMPTQMVDSYTGKNINLEISTRLVLENDEDEKESEVVTRNLKDIL